MRRGGDRNSGGGDGSTGDRGGGDGGGRVTEVVVMEVRMEGVDVGDGGSCDEGLG